MSQQQHNLAPDSLIHIRFFFNQQQYRTAPGLPIVFYIYNKKHFPGLSLNNTLPVRTPTISTKHCFWFFFPPSREPHPLLSFSRQNPRSVFFSLRSITTKIPGTVLPPHPSCRVQGSHYDTDLADILSPLFFSQAAGRLTFFIPPPGFFIYIPTLFSFQLRLDTDTFVPTVL